MMKNILLIDDDEVTNFYNKDLLQKNGYSENIYVALNGEEGLNVLKKLFDEKQQSIDIIFLDINMPIMNGFEFLEEYEKLDSRLKSEIIVCMLTSSMHKSDIQNIEKYNSVNSYVEKALTKEKMDNIIKTYFS